MLKGYDTRRSLVAIILICLLKQLLLGPKKSKKVLFHHKIAIFGSILGPIMVTRLYKLLYSDLHLSVGQSVHNSLKSLINGVHGVPSKPFQLKWSLTKSGMFFLSRKRKH